MLSNPNEMDSEAEDAGGAIGEVIVYWMMLYGRGCGEGFVGVKSSIPMSQKRDMGHPISWLVEGGLVGGPRISSIFVPSLR